MSNIPIFKVRHLFLNDEKVCKVYKILKPNQIIELTHVKQILHLQTATFNLNWY